MRFWIKISIGDGEDRYDMRYVKIKWLRGYGWVLCKG